MVHMWSDALFWNTSRNLTADLCSCLDQDALDRVRSLYWTLSHTSCLVPDRAAWGAKMIESCEVATEWMEEKSSSGPRGCRWSCPACNLGSCWFYRCFLLVHYSVMISFSNSYSSEYSCSCSCRPLRISTQPKHLIGCCQIRNLSAVALFRIYFHFHLFCSSVYFCSDPRNHPWSSLKFNSFISPRRESY